MITKQWRHLAYNFQEGGIREVGSKIVTKVRDFFRGNNQPFLLYRVAVCDYVVEPELKLTHKVADLEELKRIEYFKLQTFPEMIEKRLARGHKCHAFYLDGAFVNLIWETKDTVFVSETQSIECPETMGLQDGFTKKEFRRRGINYATHIMLVHLARDEGYKYVVGTIEPENFASLGTYKKAGYSPFMRVTIKRRFGMAKLHVEPISDL